MLSVPSNYLQVTAALIPFKGRLFVAQRPPHKKFGLCWEFPGGKVEAGESLENALAREIEEELCWEIQVKELFQTVRYRRSGFGIDLHAFWCSIRGGALKLKEHVTYRWATVEELKQLNLTEPDRHLISLIGELPATVEKAPKGAFPGGPIVCE